ncbi:hypothetical protein [Pseudomonas purpurea]|uniref:hypothetical protein n=1 Tax=Pseudomonas purpurea TaxID=3136737 RepID=UPI003263A861
MNVVSIERGVKGAAVRLGVSLMALLSVLHVAPAAASEPDLAQAYRIDSHRIGKVVARYVLTFRDECMDVQVMDPDGHWKVLSARRFCSFEGKSFNDGFAHAGFEDLRFAEDGLHATLVTFALRGAGEELRACLIPIQGPKVKAMQCAEPEIR